jgi:Cu-processing system ATP-binding protein
LPKQVIEVAQVSKRFGDVVAVDRADLAVLEGEVFGLIGHNGAGKSTLFKMMLGLLPTSSGEIRLEGSPVRGPGFREVRRRLAYLPENVVFYDNLTGLETLRYFAALKGADARQCPALLAKVGLTQAAHRPVRGYSKGMRQRLGFAQALLGSPWLLFLDEPTTGLDPVGIREFYQILQELKEQGVTAILSSHNLGEIQDRVDRLALMRMGRIQAVGTVQALREELDLPVRIRATLRDHGEPVLRRALAELDCELEVNGAVASVQCGRTRKMPVLAALMALDGTLTDLQIHEPSLEDVFIGYARADA